MLFCLSKCPIFKTILNETKLKKIVEKSNGKKLKNAELEWIITHDLRCAQSNIIERRAVVG